jgi:hypothetical protein
MPSGELVNVPLPVLLTLKVKVFKVNVAVTDRAAAMVTAHVPDPELPSPLHPVMD